MTNILAIHGAYSSPNSFNYLKSQLPEYDWIFVDYSDINTKLSDVYARVNSALETLDKTKKYNIISHSIGGLAALNIANNSLIDKITTISSPIGGMEFNPISYILATSTFPRDINQYSHYIKSIVNGKYDSSKFQHLISTKGYNPYYYNEVNDCVVSLWSQNHWTIGQTHELPYNHFEMLINPDTVKYIKDFNS